MQLRPRTLTLDVPIIYIMSTCSDFHAWSDRIRAPPVATMDAVSLAWMSCLPAGSRAAELTWFGIAACFTRAVSAITGRASIVTGLGAFTTFVAFFTSLEVRHCDEPLQGRCLQAAASLRDR